MFANISTNKSDKRNRNRRCIHTSHSNPLEIVCNTIRLAVSNLISVVSRCDDDDSYPKCPKKKKINNFCYWFEWCIHIKWSITYTFVWYNCDVCINIAHFNTILFCFVLNVTKRPGKKKNVCYKWTKIELVWLKTMFDTHLISVRRAIINNQLIYLNDKNVKLSGHTDLNLSVLVNLRWLSSNSCHRTKNWMHSENRY